MKAGRELDAMVAEKVMGFCIACSLLDEHDPEILVPKSWVGRDTGRTTGTVSYPVAATETDGITISLETGLSVNQGHSRCTLHDLPLIYKHQAAVYSTEIAPAWKVVEKLALTFELGWFPADKGLNWDASFGEKRGSEEGTTTYADTAPLAICLAALKALQASP